MLGGTCLSRPLSEGRARRVRFLTLDRLCVSAGTTGVLLRVPAGPSCQVHIPTLDPPFHRPGFNCIVQSLVKQ
jgi:hypothetical protein